MKTSELLEARQETYGIVVSRERDTGKFEDLRLVDFATDNILDGRQSHANNMFNALIHVARNRNKWEAIEPLLKHHSRQQKELGPDFDDIENFVVTKYGPYTADELGHLSDYLEEV